MRTQPARNLSEIVLGFVVVAGLFTVLWFLAPETQPFLLLGALVVTVVLYLGMYILQRRRHW